MTLKNRFFLIACGIVLFAILAPAAIFFARGFRYDFSQNRLVKTGTLSVRSDPRGAILKLNGQILKKLSPLNKRFLLPGEYRIELQKKGYQVWKKQVTIYEQMVTYLPPTGPKKIILFLESPVKTSLASSTIDVLFPSAPPPTEDSSLSQYYLSPEERRLYLRNPDGASSELLAENLPSFTAGQIIATAPKQILLFLDGALYRVGSDLRQINSRISYASWNKDAGILVYGNDHEIWLYFPDQEKSELLTRSSKLLGPALYNHKTGYAFVAEENEIKAIEYDNSGQPNVYTLAETSTPLPRFKVNNDGTELTYLDGPELITLKIR